MYEEEFVKRLTQLRMQKGVSARDMSLSIGQSETYINKIENGASLPSMSVFFYICDYFNISPAEFFDVDTEYPEKTKSIIKNLKRLNGKQLDHISSIIEDITHQ